MDLKQLVNEENEAASKRNEGDQQHKPMMDSSSALQSFLDHIPITPILTSSASSTPSGLELKSGDYVREAISMLYNKNVSGAPIVDDVDSDIWKFVDRDIGFIEFSSMVLWSLEEIEKIRPESKRNSSGFLSMLKHVPQIGQTKIGELANAFLWEPFFPVNSNVTLFHVLLLFVKHPRLKIIPVVESSNSSVNSFINQNAVVQLLLQSSGLEWFDQIADKTIAEFGYEKTGKVFCVYGDQTVADVFHVLWEKKTDGVPVVDRTNETLIGIIRRSDIYLLLEDDNLFNCRKSLTAKGVINRCGRTTRAPERSCGANLSAHTLLLKNDLLPKMNTSVTNQRSESLKQAMKKLVASNSTESFLVDESGRLEGVLTLRDIISQFSPPSVDSRIDGGGFFQAALEQAGCHVKDGALIYN